ncbi:hypothetical protein NHG22_15655, partial [Streptomyces sp. ATE26]|uniref:hypothetical protein n=1 Tax=Streptomyces sp. ATE26 TaxID=2954237 RepID=UPI002482D103
VRLRGPRVLPEISGRGKTEDEGNLMERKGIRLLIAFATAIVFAWSVAMVALGQVAAIAVLAPVLGLTVQQIARAIRSQPGPGAGGPEMAVSDSGEEAP